MAVKLEIVRKLVGAEQDISVTSPVEEAISWLDEQGLRYEFEERAAILEYDGGLSREQADKQAFTEIRNRIREGRLSR